MPKPKRGKLKDIKTTEVSMVDKPASKLPFVFFKREGKGLDLLTKKKAKISINIESDGTGKGTKILVNEEELGEVRDFSFYFYGNDAQSPVSCSYSKVVESEDGFKRTESFYLSKGEIVMDEKTLKALQEYLGTEDIDLEKKVDEGEIQKTIELITKHYKESFPQDLEDAVGILAKCAANSYAVEENKDLEKAGAKFSKDVVKKLQAVIAAVEAIKSILPDMKESTEKAEGSESKEMAELTKQLAELKEAIAKAGLEKKDDTSSAAAKKIADAFEALSKRIETIEKVTATKKSIDGQDDDDDDKQKGAGEDGKVLWPSLA